MKRGSNILGLFVVVVSAIAIIYNTLSDDVATKVSVGLYIMGLSMLIMVMLGEKGGE